MSGGGGVGPLMPTFHGFVNDTFDGLLLFEACLTGKLHHVPRRPHDRERTSIIKSGSIFIYEENASDIKRWTDGVAWSPSRILGNFLIYRELEKPFAPGEKKRAMKRKRSSPQRDPYSARTDDSASGPSRTPPDSDPPATEEERSLDRSLIGSLVDSYGFRPNGLVKKTLSITLNGISHHMVSYYRVDDVKSGRLQRPTADPQLAGIRVRRQLFTNQNFRVPVEESDSFVWDENGNACTVIYSPAAMAAQGPSRYITPAPAPQYINTAGYPVYAMAGSYAGWPQQAPSLQNYPYAFNGNYSGIPVRPKEEQSPQQQPQSAPHQTPPNPYAYAQYPPTTYYRAERPDEQSSASSPTSATTSQPQFDASYYQYAGAIPRAHSYAAAGAPNMPPTYGNLAVSGASASGPTYPAYNMRSPGEYNYSRQDST